MAKGVALWIDIEATRASILVEKMCRHLRRGYIHDYRVAIKKLKAVTGASADVKQFNAAYPHVTLLYNKAGKLRDLQIIQDKLSTLVAWPFSTNTSQLLSRIIEKKKRNIRKLLTDPQLQDFIREEFRKIAALKTHPLHVNKMPEPARDHEEEWHEIRKEAKENVYQQDAVYGAESPAPSRKHLNALQQLLGNWHDWQITLQWLQKQKAVLPAGEYWLLKQQAESALHQAADTYKHFK